MKKTYSLRAECMFDADQLKNLVNETSTTSEVRLNPAAVELDGPSIEIYTELGLDVLQELIRSIDDGHVMLQTLQPVPLNENNLERNLDQE